MHLGLPADLTWYRLFQDQGVVIAGCLAILAGILVYLAARRHAAATLAILHAQTKAARDSAQRQLQRRRAAFARGAAIELQRLAAACDSAADGLWHWAESGVAALPAKDYGVEIPPLLRAGWEAMALLKADDHWTLVILLNRLDQANKHLGDPEVASMARDLSNEFTAAGETAHELSRILFPALHGTPRAAEPRA